MSNGQTSVHKSPPFDWIVTAICEGTIILIVGGIGLLTRNALIFSSLGATAFEQVEKSRSKSARPYSVVLGHLSGIVCGFASVALLRVWKEPAVLSSHELTAGRLWAAVLAVTLTAAVNQLMKATQPAACSTTLLVAMGSFSGLHQAFLLVAGVLAIAFIGEPMRRLRIRTSSPETLH